MKRKMFRWISVVLCFGMMASLLAGCGPKEVKTSQTPPPSASADSPTNPLTEPEQSVQAPEETPYEGQTATLYVGTKAIGFVEYPLAYKGELTPEILIQGIADLTGWDLTLAKEVTSGKGGMSVCPLSP